MTMSDIKWINLSLASVESRKWQVSGISYADITELSRKLGQALKESNKNAETVALNLTDMEKDIFIATARDIIKGKHYPHDLESVTGYDLETLTEHWRQTAQNIGKIL